MNINLIKWMLISILSSQFIFAGIVEIVDDIFVKDNFNSENVTYILSGLILQFIGLLVHDSIRGKVDDTPVATEE